MLCGGRLDARGGYGGLDGVGGQDAQHADDDGQAPGGFLYESGGLTVAHILVALRVVGSQAGTFRFLYQHCAGKQDARQHNQDCEKDIHLVS